MDAALVPAKEPCSPGAAGSAIDCLFGASTVARRFAGLSGRVLQKKLFEAYRISNMSTPFYQD
eukprot:8993855-Pyramimonas_sp.AAC.1